MLRQLALTTALMLSVDAATTALAPTGGLFTSVAVAADFTGKIKRIRIRKRRVGSGYKVVAVTEGGSADSVARVDISFSDAVTGALLDELSIDEPGRARVIARDDSGTEVGDSITVTIEAQALDSSGDPFGEQQEFEVSVDGLDARTAEGAGDDGWKVRVRTSAAGELTIIVLNEHRDWDGSGVGGVSYVTAADAEPVAVAIEEVRQRFTSALSDDFVFEDDVAMRTDIYDADGTLLDSQVETVRPTTEEVTPGVDQVSLRETKKGDAKLVTWTSSDGRAAALEVSLVDSETGEEVISTVDDTPVTTLRGYIYQDLEFDPGEAPGGYIYLCLIDLLDDSGDPYGEQLEVELPMPIESDDGSITGMYTSLPDGSGALGFLSSGEGFYTAHLILEGDGAASVASANIIFEEPYEGPAPLESEVNTSLVVQYDKWVQKGQGSVPDRYELVTTLTAEDGTVLDSSAGSGSGTGNVYQAAEEEGDEEEGKGMTGIVKRRTKGGFVVDIDGIEAFGS